MTKTQPYNTGAHTSHRSYVKVAILSILISSVFVFGYVFFYSLHIYHATSDLAKNVNLANVALARQVCLQYFFSICLLQFTYLAPIAAVTTAAICCLTWRTLMESPQRSGSEIFMSLCPAPFVALLVFLFNPHAQFLVPFDPVIWRTFYLPASRGQMVQPLLESVAYKGMDSAALKALLGCPDYEKTNPDTSGDFSYSVAENNGKQLYFYFDKHKKVFDSKVKENGVDWFDGGYGR